MSDNNQKPGARVVAMPPGQAVCGRIILSALGIPKMCGKPAVSIWQFTITNAVEAEAALRNQAMVPASSVLPLCADCEGDQTRVCIGVQRIPQSVIAMPVSSAKRPA